MTNVKRILLAATISVSGILLISGVFFTYRVEAACTNPNPIPTGYAAPCPVFSLSATTVPQSGTLTLIATPQAGTSYIYTTAYIYQNNNWTPYTLVGNNVYTGYSSIQASHPQPSFDSISPSPILKQVAVPVSFIPCPCPRSTTPKISSNSSPIKLR